MSEKEPLQLELIPGEVEISPLLFGHFIEFIENCMVGGVYDPGSPSSDAKGIRQDVLEKAQGLRPTILRWPGGTYVNIFHWMDSVGPLSERKKRRNLIWGGVNDGVFGTAEFIEYCKNLGAEPMLCVNMASGTPEEAANWVEYCNGEAGSYYADLRIAHGYPEPFHLKYWCIGNESHAEPDLGAQHDPDRYISDGWEFTKHMKLTDPTIKLVFVGNAIDPVWNEKILDAFSNVCDYFSIHHYSGGSEEYAPFGSLKRFREVLDQTISMLHTYNEKDVPFNKWYRFPRRADDIKLSIDEWNIWNSTPRGENNRFGVKMVFDWKDALWTACMMNTFVHYAEDIGIANLAQMVNVLAPIMTEGDASYIQTTYHVLKLYRDYLQGKRVDCRLTSPTFTAEAAGELEALSCAAGLRDDGSIALFITNIDKENAYTVQLLEGKCAKQWICLSAASFDAKNALNREVVRREERTAQNSLQIEPGTVNMLLL